MKSKLCFSLSEEMAKRLETTAKQTGTNKSAIVEAALNRYLGSEHATSNDDAVLTRVNRVSRQLEHLDRDLKVVSETVALHARYQLTVTPPLPDSQHRDACALGHERFDVFAAQVGRRLHLGTPLIRETLDRLSTTSPDLFSREIDPPLAMNGEILLSQTDPPPIAEEKRPEDPDPAAGEEAPEDKGRLSPL